MQQYLERIGVEPEGLEPDQATLRRLQRRHLLAVPFENLDIHWHRPIALDIEKFYDKIVTRRRGGFCYELNGLFNRLLQHIGYITRLVSARVFNGRDHGPEFDHAAIIVTINGDDYLADVGFGAFTAEPLRFSPGEKQQDAAGIFVIRKFDDSYIEVAKQEAGAWRSEYIFRDIARDITEFAEMCDFQQYGEDSHFRKGKLCSIMTDAGRKTLTDKSFIVTANTSRQEAVVDSDEHFYQTLEREFGIVREQ